MIVAAVIATALAGARPARADVLVSVVPPVLACGSDIEVGVWYQAYSGGPRWARIRIKSINGTTLVRRNVRATSRWRYWHYTPRCGRRYRVQYTTPNGTLTYPVRVRRR